MLPSATEDPDRDFMSLLTRMPKVGRLPSSWKSQFSDLGGIDFLQEVVPTNSSERKRDPQKKSKQLQFGIAKRVARSSAKTALFSHAQRCQRPFGTVLDRLGLFWTVWDRFGPRSFRSDPVK